MKHRSHPKLKGYKKNMGTGMERKLQWFSEKGAKQKSWERRSSNLSTKSAMRYTPTSDPEGFAAKPDMQRIKVIEVGNDQDPIFARKTWTWSLVPTVH